ncbi:MAG: hypothetical protein ACRDIV_07115 [Ktedonobacteraceae bacterium]
MNISPEEAQEALAVIRQTTEKTRKGHGYVGYYLMIWGAVWFVGFMVSQYLQSKPAVVGWTWGGLVLVAWVSCAVMGVKQGRYIRSQVGPQIGFFYLTLFAFTALWYVLLMPQNTKQGAMFFVSIIMFAGIVIGIFSRNLSTVIGSVSVMILAIVGYYLLPAYFYLWEAIFGGFAMFATGLALLFWRWR